MHRSICSRVATRAVMMAAVAAMVCTATAAIAEESEIEANARHARQGAGLRIGVWDAKNLADPQTGTASTSAAFEGYFEKGLDMHLSWENTIGLWWRTRNTTETGVFGQTQREFRSYVVPALTALRVHPFTKPSDVLEPFATAGVGFVFGIDRESASSADPAGPSGDVTELKTGFGLKAGVGLDWRPGNRFGLSVAGKYQWTNFSEELGGEKTYEGLGVDVGVTYRFQYR